jgi:hypothetical protein
MSHESPVKKLESPVDEPAHWRERAMEARKMANLMHGPGGKGTMLRIAEGYERVAEMAVRRLAHQPVESCRERRPS